MLDLTRRTLANGLRVIVVRMPHLHSVTHALMVRTGPRFESRATNGISHLVEHLLFRGTAAHPSSFEFNAALESLGAEINGQTQRDATTIHVTLPPAAAERGLQLLGELCTTPCLDGVDVERGVVIEEILDTTDALGCELDLDTISREILWANHPIGLPVAGRVENVEALTEEDCRAHFGRTFTARNSVLCIAGPVDGEQMFETAQRAFGSMPTGFRLAYGLTPRPQRRQPVHVQESDGSQISLLLSYPAPHENHPDFPSLLMLRRILDDGLSSRLRQEICERRGLAYSINAAMDVYSDAGAFDVEAHCSPPNLAATFENVLRTLEDIAVAGVTDDELQRAKTRHQADLHFALDDPAEMAAWCGAAEVVGCRFTYEERLRQALAVQPEDIARLARSMFELDAAVVTLVGPVEVEHASEVEALTGREPDSTVWLNEDQEDPDVPDASEPPIEGDASCTSTPALVAALGPES